MAFIRKAGIVWAGRFGGFRQLDRHLQLFRMIHLPPDHAPGCSQEIGTRRLRLVFLDGDPASFTDQIFQPGLGQRFDIVDQAEGGLFGVSV